MTIRLIFSILLIFQVAIINAQQPSADSVLKEATAKAVLENKNAFIIFHASWCIWCHKLDSSINDKRCKTFFDDNYIIRHITVSESKNKKQLENPGAFQMLSKYSGQEAGLPFWLIFDKTGKLLTDSRIRDEEMNAANAGNNTGCPATDKEVNYFIRVLKKTSHLTGEQLSIIEKRFRQNEE